MIHNITGDTELSFNISTDRLTEAYERSRQSRAATLSWKDLLNMAPGNIEWQYRLEEMLEKMDDHKYQIMASMAAAEAMDKAIAKLKHECDELRKAIKHLEGFSWNGRQEKWASVEFWDPRLWWSSQDSTKDDRIRSTEQLIGIMDGLKRKIFKDKLNDVWSLFTASNHLFSINHEAAIVYLKSWSHSLRNWSWSSCKDATCEELECRIMW